MVKEKIKPTASSLKNQTALLKYGRIGINEKINRYNNDIRRYISDFLEYHELNNANIPVIDIKNNRRCYLRINDKNTLEIVYKDDESCTVIGLFTYDGDEFTKIEQTILSTFKHDPVSPVSVNNITQE